MTKQFTTTSFLNAATRTVLIRTVTNIDLGCPKWTIVDVLTGLRNPDGGIAWLARLYDMMNYNGPTILDAERLGFDLDVWRPTDEISARTWANEWLDNNRAEPPSSTENLDCICHLDTSGDLSVVHPSWLPLKMVLDIMSDKLAFELALALAGIEPIQPNPTGRDEDYRREGHSLPIGGHDPQVLKLLQTRYRAFMTKINSTALGVAGFPVA